MRWTWVLVLVALAGPAAAQEIEVAASLPHGLLYLLDCLREEPHHSAHLRDYFRTRHPLQPEEESALAVYRALLEESPWANLRFPVSPPGKGGRSPIHQRSLRDVLEVLAVRADTLGHFLEDARAVLPPRDAAVLERVCRRLEEPYRQSVWEPCREDLQRQMGELEAGFSRADAPRRVRQAARFYGSRWPADQSFVVVLTPLPREPGQKFVTHGHSNGHLQVVEVPVGASQEHAAAVVFHELCHALYGARDPEDEEALAGWFRAQPEAYQQLNEGLATALGNGWFARLVTGKLPEEAWYNDRYVDGYARELYPLVEDYLDASRSLDQAFATRAAESFAARFPQAGEDPALVLRRLLLLSMEEGDVSGVVRSELSRMGRIHSLSAGAPLTSAQAHQQFEELEDTTAVFLLGLDQIDLLCAYPFSEAELALLKGGRTPFVWLKRVGARWLVLSVAADPAARLAGLRRLFGLPALQEGWLG